MALKGIKVIEFAGLAPAPFCGMVLSDFGAQVTRIDKTAKPWLNSDTLARGKRSVSVDLKKPEGISVVRKLCSTADVVIEPFRKGVMEKLGLGPEPLMKDNPGLVFARMTGYGHTGPLADKAGHDINYIAHSGVLAQLGRKDENPHPPINLVADFGGGGMTCALGILLALLERNKSGKGQVVDANMVQGSAYLSTFLWTSRALPIWPGVRGENVLDGGAAFYGTYRTKDDKFVSLGALEPQFYADLLKGLGLTKEEMPQTSDPDLMKKTFEKILLTKSRDEWKETFKDLDACFAPVLEMAEAESHPHNVLNHTFISDSNGGTKEPAPAPRLSRTPGVAMVKDSPKIGEHTVSILLEAGLSKENIDELLKSKVLHQAENSKAKL